MGCCNSNKKELDSDYDKLIFLVLQSFPLNLQSSKFCRSQFKTCELEINTNRNTFSGKKSSNKLKTQSKQDINFEYNEEKYYIAIEFLYKMIFPDKDLKESVLRKTTDITKTSLKNISTSENKLHYLEPELYGQFESQIKEQIEIFQKEEKLLENPINRLYFAITPSFSDLFDKILKDKPESSFLLFVIGFTKEDPKKKAEMFSCLAECGGIKLNLSNFKIMIQSYLEMHYSFSRLLYDMIAHNKSLIGHIYNSFKLKIDDHVLRDWYEFNILVETKKTFYSNDFAHRLSQELLNIILSETKPENIDKYMRMNKGNLDHLSVIEVCELIIKYNNTIIDQEYLVSLLTIHPYLFEAKELRSYLNKEIGYKIV